LRLRRPSHATVVAYLALFCAIGGSAYAVSKVRTADLKRAAVTSPKIENRAVKGKDIATGAVGARQLRDRFEPAELGLNGAELPDCDPTSATAIDCGTVSVSLAEEGRILALVSGGQYSEGGPASVSCEILVDSTRTGGRTGLPGEIAMDNTSLSATNGFARTAVSQQLPPGTHQVSLACSELGGDARLAAPTIAALAIPGKE